MVFVGSVRKVHPGHVHAGVDHLEEELWRSGDGPDGADDAGQPDVRRAAEDPQRRQVLDHGARLAGLGLSIGDGRLGQNVLEKRGENCYKRPLLQALFRTFPATQGMNGVSKKLSFSVNS